jgi:hypothetical protein
VHRAVVGNVGRRPLLAHAQAHVTTCTTWHALFPSVHQVNEAYYFENTSLRDVRGSVPSCYLDGALRCHCAVRTRNETLWFVNKISSRQPTHGLRPTRCAPVSEKQEIRCCIAMQLKQGRCMDELEISRAIGAPGDEKLP